MGDAEAKDQGLPIGSAVVEATCKTLVTQRLERSGMRRSERGGQAIPTLRALRQSNRFEAGWALLSETYRAEVSVPDHVVPLRRPIIHSSMISFGGTPQADTPGSFANGRYDCRTERRVAPTEEPTEEENR